MNRHLFNAELTTLHNLLIEKNKEFTEAMKLGKPHMELVRIYKHVKDIFSEINQRKRMSDDFVI